jgi:2-polyprenyl-6-methoxyphenol hydroxylase-like FAD-dependent oxidoreductase
VGVDSARLRCWIAERGSGLALLVEDDKWLVVAAGYSDRRPSRDPTEFVPFLNGLRDPAIADLVRALGPISDVVTYRQTSNRRHSYGEHRAWPGSLIVVGDAYCAFNPIYGQGITVAASTPDWRPQTANETSRPLAHTSGRMYLNHIDTYRARG